MRRDPNIITIRTARAMNAAIGPLELNPRGELEQCYRNQTDRRNCMLWPPTASLTNWATLGWLERIKGRRWKLTPFGRELLASAQKHYRRQLEEHEA